MAQRSELYASVRMIKFIKITKLIDKKLAAFNKKNRLLGGFLLPINFLFPIVKLFYLECLQ
jgi:hypothetical protein